MNVKIQERGWGVCPLCIPPITLLKRAKAAAGEYDRELCERHKQQRALASKLAAIFEKDGG